MTSQVGRVNELRCLFYTNEVLITFSLAKTTTTQNGLLLQVLVETEKGVNSSGLEGSVILIPIYRLTSCTSLGSFVTTENNVSVKKFVTEYNW